jgi:hypothetical protein
MFLFRLYMFPGIMNNSFGKYHRYCKYYLLLILFIVSVLSYSLFYRIYLYFSLNIFIMVSTSCPVYVNVSHFCFPVFSIFS